jgi:UDP-N-acetylglucosamine 2-epimerase (non-hydrolysing)
LRLMTILGTRPEIIRLSIAVPLLDRLCEQTLVHTGQNYDEGLSDVFFRELGLRKPDVNLAIRAGGFGDQVGQILAKASKAMEETKPDRVLILGDTNSGLAAIVAARNNIPVFHMEAGNRCYDDRVPEEINRRIIDHCSTVLMPYTQRSKENLVREGIERERIFVTGNPIYEVIQRYKSEIDTSEALHRLSLKPRGYFLATMHRAENVDDLGRLEKLLDALQAASEKFGLPVVMSLHPRTADRMKAAGLDPSKYAVRFVAPLGFFDFVALERAARCVVTDSGTVQEECCIAHVPNVTIRDTTERPETLECGSNILTGMEGDSIMRCLGAALDSPAEWTVPPEYMEPTVSRTVAKIVIGHLPSRRTDATDPAWR